MENITETSRFAQVAQKGKVGIGIVLGHDVNSLSGKSATASTPNNEANNEAGEKTGLLDNCLEQQSGGPERQRAK